MTVPATGGPLVVAVFAPSFPPGYKGGGPSRSIDAMVRRSPEGFRPLVFTSNRDIGDPRRLEVPSDTWVSRDPAQVYYADLGSLRGYVQGLRRLRSLRPGILHFNSFFNLRLTVVPLLLLLTGFWGRPLVILSPRGEFGAGALSRHSGRKRLYRWLFALLRLHRRVVWHATADHESADLRAQWGDDLRIVLRENDTLLPLKAHEPPPAGDSLKALFLGRMVEHKGLAVALEALSSCEVELSFDVYGTPEDPQYLQRCHDLASKVPATVTVSFHGPVQPDQVRQVLTDYDLAILPTAGENFGHVIAEALSASCPVMTTSETPWTALLREGAGVVVADRSPQHWAAAIRSFASLTPSQRADARRRAGDLYTTWAARPRPRHLWEAAAQAG